MSLFKLSKAVPWSVSERWGSDLQIWKMTFYRLHSGPGLNCDSKCWEESCYGAEQENPSGMGRPPCLPMGICGCFLYMIKAQAGEAENKGNPRLRAGIFWWGWHRGLQPRLYSEERFPFPSHLSHGSGKRPGLPQLKDTYPTYIHSQKSTAIHKWRRQEDLPKTNFGNQSQLLACLSQTEECFAALPAPHLHVPGMPQQ